MTDKQDEIIHWEFFIPVAPYWEDGKRKILAEISRHAPTGESVNLSLWRLDAACRFVHSQWHGGDAPQFDAASVYTAYRRFSSLRRNYNDVTQSH